MERASRAARAMVIGAAIPVLVLAACGGGSWEESLKDPEVMQAYRQEARATGTALIDERLDDMARRLCEGWAAGESDATVLQREVVNTPAIEVSNVLAIATAAHSHVCPSE